MEFALGRRVELADQQAEGALAGTGEADECHMASRLQCEVDIFQQAGGGIEGIADSGSGDLTADRMGRPLRRWREQKWRLNVEGLHDLAVADLGVLIELIIFDDLLPGVVDFFIG